MSMKKMNFKKQLNVIFVKKDLKKEYVVNIVMRNFNLITSIVIIVKNKVKNILK